MRTLVRGLGVAAVLVAGDASIAAADPVISYGGETPCSVWLAGTNARPVQLAWILGYWSGLNVEGSLKKEAYDIGHTLTGQQIGNLVLENCRQRPGDFIALAVLSAYTQARNSQR
jgi:hypothetical protein